MLTERGCHCAQETFDLNSFFISAVASDLTVTVSAFRSGTFLTQFTFNVPFLSSRLPIELPQPDFTVSLHAQLPHGLHRIQLF